MKKSPWKTLSSKVVYKNRWLQLREDQVLNPNGDRGIYSVVETNAPAVFIVALTQDQEIYLVKLFRYTTNLWCWEIPAGGSENQEIIESGKRELKEETGLEAKSWKKIGYFQSMNGVSNELSYVLLAKDLKQTKNNKKKEEGIIAVKKVPLLKALKMIQHGEITDGQSIAALTQVMIAKGLIKTTS